MTGVFRWVALNAFLALIPVALAYGMAWYWRQSHKGMAAKTIMAGVGLAWLAFLPNTCYLLTEWRHYLRQVFREQLFDQSVWVADLHAFLLLIAYSLFFLAYSLFGLVTFALAIRPLAPIARQFFPRLWVAAVPVFVLASLGVYLGLIWRFNSWDLLHRPGYILNTAVESMSRPLLAAVIFGFAAFLWLGYQVVDIWIDGFAYRLRRQGKAGLATCAAPKHPDWIDG